MEGTTTTKDRNTQPIRDGMLALELNARDALGILHGILPDLGESFLSRVISQPEVMTTKDSVKVKRALCRFVLLPAALALSISRDRAWDQYGEHVLFGLPEPMKDEVLDEAERLVASRSQALAVSKTEEVA